MTIFLQLQLWLQNDGLNGEFCFAAKMAAACRIFAGLWVLSPSECIKQVFMCFYGLFNFALRCFHSTAISLEWINIVMQGTTVYPVKIWTGGKCGRVDSGLCRSSKQCFQLFWRRDFWTFIPGWANFRALSNFVFTSSQRKWDGIFSEVFRRGQQRGLTYCCSRQEEMRAARSLSVAVTVPSSQPIV